MSKYLHVAVAFILAIATATSWGGGQNRPPSVTLTAPANGATFTAPASITLTANASDSDGISQVDFYQGAMLLGTSKVAPYTVTWTNVPGGSYSLTARAFDKLGASATSAAISVTVSGAKVTVTSPANGATVYGDTVSVEGTFSGDAGTTIWIDNGNSSTLATQNGSNFSASVPLLLGPNTLNISVVRRDKTTDSTSLSFNGGNAPKIAFKLPETTAFEAPANIAFEVDAVSPTGTINRVEFLRDGALVATISSPPYRHVFTNQPPGSIQVTARAVDNAGNASYLTPSYIVVNAANALPTVNLTFPAANTVWQEPANITLTASASDTDGSISMVEFFQDGALLGSTNISPYSFALTNVTKGSYTYTARATDDRGGATTSAPVSITVTQPNALPTVTLTSPKDGDVYRVETEGSTAAITLEAVASDSDGTIAKVEFFQGATLIGATTTAPYSVTWNNAGPGTHVLTVKVTDNFGATTSATVNVRVTSNETITFLHNDFTGSPLAATDINGAIVWKEHYRPYGDRLNKQPASVDNRQGYHGKALDIDTGLSYFGARYYDASLGRFMGIDPVDFKESNLHSFNRYAFANNNPYRFTDPDGRASISFDVCNGFCIGGSIGYAFSSGELALVGRLGAGVGGGLVIDPRLDQNGRPGGPDSNGGAGVTLGAYGQAGGEFRTPLGGAGIGGKVIGGKDFGADKGYGELSPDGGFGPSGKFSAKAGIGGGAEASIYYNPVKVFEKFKESVIHPALQALEPRNWLPPEYR